MLDPSDVPMLDFCCSLGQVVRVVPLVVVDDDDDDVVVVVVVVVW